MTVPLANVDYQTPTGEVAVQWNSLAASQLFNELGNDQVIPAPGPAKAAKPKSSHGSSPAAGNTGSAASGSTGTGSGTPSATASPGNGPSGNTAAQDACR
jgi:hypothetical protein